MASCAALDRLRFRDFVQRVQLEAARDELRELDEAKSRFTANIHHELRTPLTLMLAPLDSMLAGEFGEVGEAQRGYLAMMQKNALRLLKLINNLLDHARIESGQMELQRRALEVEGTVREIVESARAMAERKGVELVVEIASALPTINADPDAVEKIVVNLIGNALKFTDAGGRIDVRVGRGAAEDGAAGVEIEVCDTGVGIAPDKLERVFDRFAQVDGSATRRHEGTGIGLSLVRELTGLHGGRAWVTSAGLGLGAQFHIFLPVGREDADLEEVLRQRDGRGVSLGRSFEMLGAELEQDEIDEGSPGGGVRREAAAERDPRYRTAEFERTIERCEGATDASGRESGSARSWLPELVIAEDNADLRRLLVHLLGAEFSVRAARNGREALELIRERPPTLVVTDVMMPEMSGTELCEAIKEDPGLAGIPVMLVTSKAEREMKIRGLEMGADDYVTKPFHPRELLARARALSRLRSLQEELTEQNAALDSALQHLRQTEVQLIQAERLAAVGELAAGVAHEVNNPVNFALNSLRALQEGVGQVRTFANRLTGIDWEDAGKLSEHIRELQGLEAEVGLEEVASTLDELVGIVIEGLERTSRLVADLRDFGTPGEREATLVEVGAAIDSTLKMVGPLLGSSRIRLEVDIEPGLPAIVGDPAALKQLLLNLLKNAGEALEETGGTIRLAAGRRPDEREVLVTVTDDGPGIDSTLAERIFEPFFTTKTAGRGTGLGLSICRRIAEAHRGTLAVDSIPGTGTTFTLRLPVESQDATELRT
ncbi:response regulator [Myxococcota bacterium]|nr:response regulator [Myxococcota bacterium]